MRVEDVFSFRDSARSRGEGSSVYDFGTPIPETSEVVPFDPDKNVAKSVGIRAVAIGRKPQLQRLATKGACIRRW